MCRYTVKIRLIDCEVANKTPQHDTSRAVGESGVKKVMTRGK